MNRFAPYPFLRITAAFGLGIVVFHYLAEPIDIPWPVLPLLVLAYVTLALSNALRFKTSLGMLAFGTLFLLGYFRLQFFKDNLKESHLMHAEATYDAYEAVIIEEPEKKANSIKTVVEVLRVHHWDSVKEERTGRVNLYLDKEKAAGLTYGDVLLVKGTPQRMQGPANPGEFDYRNYLVYNNIFHQHFARADFELIGHRAPSKLIALSLELRQRSESVFRKLLPDEKVRGVVLALVLGVKEELDPEVLKAYSAAGATHVLAVSGLHVGIIYGLVLLLFQKMGLVRKKTRWLLAIVSIAVLWSYAFITGLSPSVLRAVTMFSFIAVAKASRRNTNIYNTLAASAFVLLWYNPYLLMSVGFQLSYLAVFGIVYLQPKLYALVNVDHWLLDKVWAITCVSVAAQVATGPLSVLYFHQFPSYFFISNLVVIPAAFIILIMGLSLLATGWIPFIGDVVGWVLDQTVRLTNKAVFLVEQIPGSVIEGVYIKTYETWLIYFSVLLLLLLFARKRFAFLMAAATMAFLFAMSQLIDRSGHVQKTHVSVFNVRNATVLDFESHGQTRLLGDSSFINDDDKVRFSIRPKRLTSYQPINLQDDQLNLVKQELPIGELISFHNETYLVLVNREVRRLRLKAKVPVDNIIVTRGVVSDLDQLTRNFNFKRLIIDNTNRKYLADKLLSQAESLNLEAYSIEQRGYLELKAKQ